MQLLFIQFDINGLTTLFILDKLFLLIIMIRSDLMSDIEIYTDGALRRQKHLLGAWCCLVLFPERAQLKSCIDSSPNATNNRMELLAVINGCKACFPNASIQLYTDSQYVVYGIDYGNTKTNQDLWQEYRNVIADRHLIVNVHHVYGHQTNVGNNVVDLTMRHMLDLVLH